MMIDLYFWYFRSDFWKGLSLNDASKMDGGSLWALIYIKADGRMFILLCACS